MHWSERFGIQWSSSMTSAAGSRAAASRKVIAVGAKLDQRCEPGSEAVNLLDDVQDPEERYAAFAKQYRDGKTGRVGLRQCYLCGYLQWMCTHTGEPDGHYVESLYDCPRCIEARSRAPELFHWMLGVAAQLALAIKSSAQRTRAPHE